MSSSSGPSNPDLNILSADRLAAQVHDILDRNVRHNARDPQHVLQRGDVAVVAGVVDQRRRGVVQVLLLQVRVRGDVGPVADIVCPRVRVDLLPVPPEAVQVGVVQEEERLSGGASNAQDRAADTAVAGYVGHAHVALQCGCVCSSRIVSPESNRRVLDPESHLVSQ